MPNKEYPNLFIPGPTDVADDVLAAGDCRDSPEHDAIKSFHDRYDYGGSGLPEAAVRARWSHLLPWMRPGSAT